MTVQRVKLGDLLEVQNGFAFKKEFFSESEGVPLIRIRDLDKSATEAFYTGEFREEFIVRTGDYLIGMDGEFTCHKWAGGRALLNQRVCRLRNFSNHVLPEYIFYGIGPALKAIEDGTSFATVKHISGKQILGINFPLPPLAEQRQIVGILSCAESIVRLRREAQQKAAEFVSAMFLDMFGDPATNPKGWPVAALGDLLDSADYGTSSKSSEDSSGMPVIRMGNVTYSGDLSLADLKYISHEQAEVEKYGLREGDILFNRTNSKDLVGKTGLWSGEFEAIAASYFIRLRVNRELIIPRYLWAAMNSRHMKQVLFDTARGAIGQANINSKELRAFRMCVPPLSLQQTFADRARDLRAIQHQQGIALQRARRVFDSVLHSRFGG